VKFVSTFSDGKVGVAQELAVYLREKGEDLFYLEHPLVPGPGRRSKLETFRRGTLASALGLGYPCRSQAGLYVRSFFVTLWTVFRRRGEVDLFVGHSNLDCVAARLATAGRGARVVYVSIDYNPARFSNPLLNRAYWLVDRLAYRWSTAIWHSYPDALRLKPYAAPEKCFETLHGNNCRRIRRVPWEERKRRGLVYLGGIVRPARLDLALDAVAGLASRFDDVSLDVIGEGPDPAVGEALRGRAGALGIAERVKWHGLITDAARFEEIMTRMGAALCLYEMNPNMASWYQLPGKVFAYGACGLPTIVSDRSGPVCVREIEKNGIGLVTVPEKLAECLTRLFEDETMHRRLADNAARWAAPFDWHAKFEKYLGMVEKMMGARGEGNPPRPR